MANVLNEMCRIFSGGIQLYLFLFFLVRQLRILCKPGYRKTWQKKMEHSKQSISVMFCGSAYGTYSLPMVVCRAQNI